MSQADLDRFKAAIEPIAFEAVGDENVPLASFDGPPIEALKKAGLA